MCRASKPAAEPPGSLVTDFIDRRKKLADRSAISDAIRSVSAVNAIFGCTLWPHLKAVQYS
jgi:hypothetical protein